MKKVFIVAEGSWANVAPEQYKDQVGILLEVLQKSVDADGRKEASVEVVATIADAERRAREADRIIFISRGCEAAAERIAKANPGVRAVVLTGLIPEGKVLWVEKGDRDTKMFIKLFLHW